MLQNQYENKWAIALEIIRDLQQLPPLKSRQPRKVIELIQTIEKALNDLTKPGNIEIINPAVISSIEGKLPFETRVDWIKRRNTPNLATPENYFDSLLNYLKVEEAALEEALFLEGEKVE